MEKTLLFLIVSLLLSCEGKIIGFFVLPHGGIALDPHHFDTKNATKRWEAIQLHVHLKETSEMISKMSPELIFLSTPHGLANDINFGVYQNTQGFGNAETEGNYKGYELGVPFDDSTAADFTNYMKYMKRIIYNSELIDYREKGEPISGLTAFASSDKFPLGWGEVIPLWFIEGISNLNCTIISCPTRRRTDAVKMIPEVLQLGKETYGYLNNLKKRVVVVISGDLAHTHDCDGPYGCSPSAEPFDIACGKWISTLERNYLIGPTGAQSLLDTALSCGFVGFVMLQGMLDAAVGQQWQSTLYANYHPSYYGMLVASVLPK